MSEEQLPPQNDEEIMRQAKQDAQILAEAEVIKADTKRIGLARKVAAELALKSANQSNAYANIASSGLEYPEMDRQRAEANAVAPSSGQ